MMRSLRNVLVISLPAFLSVAFLQAQQGERIAAVMAENNKLLRQYTYKQRMEVLYKGEDKLVRIAQVRFNPDGKREITQISETGGQPATGLGSRIINKKREEMKDYVTRLSELVEQYFPINAEKMRAVASTAELGGAGNLITLKVRNYLKKGDSITLALDPGSRKLRRVELSSTLDSDAISMATDLTDAPNGGPSYPSLTDIKSSSKKVEIKISAYDLQKVTG